MLLAFQVKIGQLYSEHTVDEVLERMFTGDWWTSPEGTYILWVRNY